MSTCWHRRCRGRGAGACTGEIVGAVGRVGAVRAAGGPAMEVGVSGGLHAAQQLAHERGPLVAQAGAHAAHAQQQAPRHQPQLQRPCTESHKRLDSAQQGSAVQQRSGRCTTLKRGFDTGLMQHWPPAMNLLLSVGASHVCHTQTGPKSYFQTDLRGAVLPVNCQNQI